MILIEINPIFHDKNKYNLVLIEKIAKDSNFQIIYTRNRNYSDCLKFLNSRCLKLNFTDIGIKKHRYLNTSADENEFYVGYSVMSNNCKDFLLYYLIKFLNSIEFENKINKLEDGYLEALTTTYALLKSRD